MKLALFVSGFLYILLRFYFRHSIGGFILKAFTFYSLIYLAFINYMFFTFLLIDSFHLVGKILKKDESKKEKKVYRIGIYVVVGIVLLSFINTYFIRIKEYDLHSDKIKKEQIKIVAISDLHITNISSKAFWRNVVGNINKLEADYVFLVGDIIDGKLSDREKTMYQNILSGIDSKYGTFAVLGNHEYYGNLDESIDFINGSKVILLQDEFYEDDNIIVIGQHDQHYKNRKDITEILGNLPNEKYTVLLDHTPNYFSESVKCGIDLKISGHTHNGQFFPWNIATFFVYEKAYGLIRKAHTDFIITCGSGVWGPPIRNMSRSEIVEINVTGSK